MSLFRIVGPSLRRRWLWEAKHFIRTDTDFSLFSTTWLVELLLVNTKHVLSVGIADTY